MENHAVFIVEHFRSSEIIITYFKPKHAAFGITCHLNKLGKLCKVLLIKCTHPDFSKGNVYKKKGLFPGTILLSSCLNSLKV